MGRIVNGEWIGGDDQQIGADGYEIREEPLRGRISEEPGAAHPPEAGRYHLIECPGCHLAQRVAILRRLKGLDHAVSATTVRPVMGPNGRDFGDRGGARPDPVTGYTYLHELYTATEPRYNGRASVPVLWDKVAGRIVSNSYAEVFGMLNSDFDAVAGAPDLDLRPAALEEEHARLSTFVRDGFVEAVYKCGFARDQDQYDAHAAILDRTFDALEARLEGQSFLLGSDIAEVDLILFCAMIRHDAIFATLFQCSRRRVEDSPNLTAYLARIWALPAVPPTFDLREAMEHYYVSHAHINPTRIVPRPPRMSWLPETLAA